MAESRDILFPVHMFNRTDDCRNKESSCLILLNSKLYGMENWLRRCWDLFTVKACADGGSNTLFDCMGSDKHKYIPDMICGDLDSIRQEVRSYYKEMGSDIVHLPDQDYTDFSKTLKHLLLRRKQGTVKFSKVYVMNALWGRFDQTMGNIGVLFHSSTVPIYLISEDSILFLLKPGVSVIAVDSGLEEGHCGLLPLGGMCTLCVTTGLTWNLNGEKLEMDGLISTSNIIESTANRVTVNCTHPIIWTMSHKLLSIN